VGAMASDLDWEGLEEQLRQELDAISLSSSVESQCSPSPRQPGHRVSYDLIVHSLIIVLPFNMDLANTWPRLAVYWLIKIMIHG